MFEYKNRNCVASTRFDFYLHPTIYYYLELQWALPVLTPFYRLLMLLWQSVAIPVEPHVPLALVLAFYIMFPLFCEILFLRGTANACACACVGRLMLYLLSYTSSIHTPLA